VLVYIFLAHYAYNKLNSLLISEFVLLAPMVVPVLLVSQINQLTNRIDARSLLLGTSATATVVCFALFTAIPLSTCTVLLGAGAVGTLDAVQRVARIVAIKRYFSPEEVGYTVPLTLTAQFVAGAIAGCIVAFFPGQITESEILIATVTLMMTAATCTVFLPKFEKVTLQSKASRVSLRSCAVLLKMNSELRLRLSKFVILCTFFQGFYSLSRITLPAHQLGLGQVHVGLLQIVASLSAIAGALAFYFLRRKKIACNLPLVYAACAAAMVIACVMTKASYSFSSYFVYFFLFEIAFFCLQEEIMASTSVNDMALVATVQYALVYAGMMLAIAIGAILIQEFGLTHTAIFFAGGFFVSLQLLRVSAAKNSLSRRPIS